jgi:undecaprenyl-diphosphatase
VVETAAADERVVHDGVVAKLREATTGGDRHPGDIVRVVLALGLLGICCAIALGHVSRFERNVFRLVNQLPGSFEGALTAVMQLGAVWAILGLVAVALAFRRNRLAIDLAVAGGLAAIASRGLKAGVARARPAAFVHDVVLRGVVERGHGFPSSHCAIAAALATAAAPHLPRPARRAVWALVWVVAIARVFVGAHLPIDALGGIALGWAVGAGVHLALGSPGTSTPLFVIRDALRNAGLTVSALVPVVADARGSVPFFVHTDDGRVLFCKTVGREQRDADALFKMWRYLAYREIEDEEPFSTAKHAVEHEAYLSVLAQRAGATVPDLVVTAGMADGGALLVEQQVDGHTLDALDQSAIDDRVLDGVWREVVKLHAARIAHRDLRLSNVLLADDGAPWIIDFGFSEAGASDRRLAQDVAQLLTSTAIAVGPERAVASAVRVAGADALREALPLLQPLALAAATRHQLRAHHGLLKDLRDRAAHACGTDTPPLEELRRVRGRTVLMVATLGVAVYLLLPQVGELHETLDALKSAQWGWLVAAVLASVLSYIGAGIGMLGAVAEHLALLRTTLVQVAGSFANRFTPGSLGGMGVNMRYLQREGIDVPVAVAAIGLNGVAGVFVHVTLLIAFSIAVGHHGLPDVHLPDGWLVLVVVALVLAALGLVLRSASMRARVADSARHVGRELVAVLRTPTKALALFGGSLLVTFTYMGALAASLAAFGADVHLVRIGFVYLAGAAVSSAAPTPGGLGAMEAALVAGLTAVGVPSGQAIAGVLTFRLATFWLPTLPGWLVFRRLRNDEIL